MFGIILDWLELMLLKKVRNMDLLQKIIFLN